MKGRRADSHKYQFRRKAYYDMKEEGTLEEYERFWKKKVKDDKREIKKMVKRGASEKEIEARKWEGKTKLGPMAHVSYKQRCICSRDNSRHSLNSAHTQNTNTRFPSRQKACFCALLR